MSVLSKYINILFMTNSFIINNMRLWNTQKLNSVYRMQVSKNLL